jgi:hypothetical protein
MYDFLSFYGTDWIGMAGNLAGQWYLGKQRKFGFIIGSLGCLGWLSFGIVAESPPSVVSNIIYIGLNVRAWRKWRENPPQNSET